VFSSLFSNSCTSIAFAGMGGIDSPGGGRAGEAWVAVGAAVADGRLSVVAVVADGGAEDDALALELLVAVSVTVASVSFSGAPKEPNPKSKSSSPSPVSQ
jgi:hypothetical protein